MKHRAIEGKKVGYTAFNWTKVELKLVCHLLAANRAHPFNWTKVELKLDEDYGQLEMGAAFNWTKVELKLYRRYVYSIPQTVF